MHNGPIISDLDELYEALDSEITSEQFAHHVSKSGHNDFVPWVRDVLGDVECADKISRSRTQATMAKAVATCLKGYKT